MQKRLLKIQVNSTQDELLKDFLDRKKVSGVKVKTAYQYYWILRLFLRDYLQGDIQNGKELDKAVLNFLSNKSNAYFNRSLLCLRQFFDYCLEEGKLKYNPCKAKGFKYRKESKRIVNHPPEVITELLNLPDKETFTGLRNYTLMLLMLDTGIRPGEALQLRLSDFRVNEIHVRQEIAKTKRERYLPISPVVSSAIRKFISVRHLLWDNEGGILFCGFHGKQISSGALHASFRVYAKKMNIDISPYHLRHTFALYFCRNGGDAFALQKLMGHTRLDQTLTYVHLVKGDVTEAHGKFSPLMKFLDPGEKRMVNIKPKRKGDGKK